MLLKVLDVSQIFWGLCVTFVCLVIMAIVNRALLAGKPHSSMSLIARLISGFLPLMLGLGGGGLMRLADLFPPFLWSIFGLVSGAAAWLVWEHRSSLGAFLSRFLNRGKREK